MRNCIASVSAGGHYVIRVGECPRPILRSPISAIFSRNFFVKRLIVVNYDIGISNHKEVESALSTRFQADRDLFIMLGHKGSQIDPSRSPDCSVGNMRMAAAFSRDRANVFRKIKLPVESVEQGKQAPNRALIVL